MPPIAEKSLVSNVSARRNPSAAAASTGRATALSCDPSAVSRGRRLTALVALAASTIACDRLTKGAAEAHLAGMPRRSLLGDTLRLEYVENPGAFLSLGAGLPGPLRRPLLTWATGAALLGLTGYLAARAASDRAILGLALVWAGGVSKLADRVARGQVVDFVDVEIGSLRTGIFNVADVAILLGVGLLLAVSSDRDGGATPRG
jgi:signal peptidase II